MSKRRLSLPGMIICGIAVMFLVVAGTLLYWLNAPIDLKRPARNIPQPNAYDYYLSAADQIVFERQCTEALFPGRYAGRKFPESKTQPAPPKGIPRAYILKRPYTLAEKRALLQINAPVFRILYEGFKYESLSPSEETGPHFANNLKLNGITKLINLKIQAHNEPGEYNQALQTYLNGIEFRNDCLNGVALNGYMASLWDFRIISTIKVDKLDSRQARSAVARLEYLQSRSVAFEDIMQESRNVDLSFAHSELAFALKLVNTWRYGGVFYDNLKYALTKRSELNKLAAVWDNAMEYASKPYPEFIKLTIPSNIKSIEDLSSICYANCFFEGDRCINDLLMLRLALRAYKLDNGKYPVKLDDLSPGYLKRIPKDPFALKGQYKYRLNGSSYKLYSIGPDCKDDGGRAFISGNMLPDIADIGDFCPGN